MHGHRWAGARSPCQMAFAYPALFAARSACLITDMELGLERWQWCVVPPLIVGLSIACRLWGCDKVSVKMSRARFFFDMMKKPKSYLINYVLLGVISFVFCFDYEINLLVTLLDKTNTQASTADLTFQIVFFFF